MYSTPVIDDLERLISILRNTKPGAQGEVAYNAMLTLCDIYRPSSQRPSDNTTVLDNEVRILGATKRIEAYKHVRGRLGIGLREAKDYVDRLLGP